MSSVESKRLLFILALMSSVESKILLFILAVAVCVPLIASNDVVECGSLSSDCQSCSYCCFKFNENSPPGTFVGNLNQIPNSAGLDMYLDSNRSLDFDLQNNFICNSDVLRYKDWFTISSIGTVRTIVQLDNEYYRDLCGGSSCLQMLAVVKYSDPQPGEGPLLFPVSINLADLNDNSPQFLYTQLTNFTVFSQTVEETEDTNTQLFCSSQLTATDADTSQVITYTVLSSTDDEFSVSVSVGKVCVYNHIPLDRESISNISFIIEAQDEGNLTSSITVVLTILDDNDNPPVFTNPILELDVFENTTVNSVIAQYTATDEDIGPNAAITYSIMSDDTVPFVIDNSTGELYVSGELNADDNPPVSYSFKIKAQDGPGLFSDESITVNIRDVNDNHPTFVSIVKQYTTIAEGPIADPAITRFIVMDIDVVSSPINKWRAFVESGSEYVKVLSSNFSPFVVDNLGIAKLVFKVDELDYETVKNINITLVISDGGDPELTAFDFIFINITDVNDNAPNLTRTEFRVNEEEEKGTVLFFLNDYFQDDDSDTDNNNKLGEFVELSNNPYVIVSPNGAVKVGETSDREKGDTILFEVLIFDDGNPRLNSSRTILIYLQDVNDNKPVFVEPVGPFNISEDNESQFEFGRVEAVDNDSGPNGTVRYRLAGDNSELFSINTTTGALSSLVELDREERSAYTLTVVAEDMGLRCNSTLGPCNTSIKVIVNVQDLNDNSPLFRPNVTTEFTVWSNITNSTIIGSVTATDDDTGANADVNYRLDNTTTFNIHSNGSIFTVKKLGPYDAGEHHLSVTAFNENDRKMNSTLPIEITVLQSNSSSNNNALGTMYLYGLIALAAFVLVVTIMIVSCCICCVCFHCQHSQSKTLPPLPPLATTPKKSSLKIGSTMPISKEDVEEEAPINGDIPRSPTVIFSEEYQVRYFSQDQSMAKSGGKTETVHFTDEGKFNNTVIESPQILTKDVHPEVEEVSSPPLSEDLSSNSSLSNSLYHSTATNQYYEQQQQQQQAKNHLHLPLREDTLKKHNEAISENYGGHSSILYPPPQSHIGTIHIGTTHHDRMYPSEHYTVSNGHYPHGMVDDDRDVNEYDGLPQHNQCSSHHRNQSISQNSTPPNANSIPQIRIQFMEHHAPHHGKMATPAVCYSHQQQHLPPHYSIDQPSPVYYDDPPLQKPPPLGLLHYTSSSSSSNSSDNIHRLESNIISPPNLHPQSTHYPLLVSMQHHPIPRHRIQKRSHNPTSQLSPLAEYPLSHLPPNPHHSIYSRTHDRYANPHKKDPPAHLYVVSEDAETSTVASSLLDNYLQFDAHLPRHDYLLSDAISVDDRWEGLSERENKESS